jgi:hypothetical protein
MLSRKCSSGEPSHNIGAFFNTIGQKLTPTRTGSPSRAAVVGQLPTDNAAGILLLGCEYVAVAILGQRADVWHQPVSTRNAELVGDRKRRRDSA